MTQDHIFPRFLSDLAGKLLNQFHVLLGGAEEEVEEAVFAEAHPLEHGDDVVIFRPGMTMDEMEKQAIIAALASVNGNRRKAAELLGIGERTLYRKISKYELEEEEE